MKAVNKYTVTLVLKAEANLNERDLAAYFAKIGQELDGVDAVDSVNVTSCATVAALPSGERKEIVLYVPADEDLPYFQVNGYGDTAEEKPIAIETGDVLREVGVVVEIFCRYPRADRYGVPMEVVHDQYGNNIVGDHSFVGLDALQVQTEDSGDDTPGCYWFKLSVPADLVI